MGPLPKTAQTAPGDGILSGGALTLVRPKPGSAPAPKAAASTPSVIAPDPARIAPPPVRVPASAPAREASLETAAAAGISFLDEVAQRNVQAYSERRSVGALIGAFMVMAAGLAAFGVLVDRLADRTVTLPITGVMPTPAVVQPPPEVHDPAIQPVLSPQAALDPAFDEPMPESGIRTPRLYPPTPTHAYVAEPALIPPTPQPYEDASARSAPLVAPPAPVTASPAPAQRAAVARLPADPDAPVATSRNYD